MIGLAWIPAWACQCTCAIAPTLTRATILGTLCIWTQTTHDISLFLADEGSLLHFPLIVKYCKNFLSNFDLTFLAGIAMLSMSIQLIQEEVVVKIGSMLKSLGVGRVEEEELMKVKEGYYKGNVLKWYHGAGGSDFISNAHHTVSINYNIKAVVGLFCTFGIVACKSCSKNCWWNRRMAEFKIGQKSVTYYLNGPNHESCSSHLQTTDTTWALYCSQLYHHFTRSFWANILVQVTKPNCN